LTTPTRTPLPPPTAEPPDDTPRRASGRYVRLALLLLLLAFLLWAGLKAWRVAGAARSLLAVEDEARALAAGGLAGLDAGAAEALLLGARADVVTLRDELAFARPIAPYLGWLPRFGPTLVAAPHLLDMADGGTEAAVLAVGNLKPALATVQGEGFGMDSLGELLPTLAAAGPALQEAGAALDRTVAARAELAAAVPAEQLPWRVRQLLAVADEWLPLGQSGLRLAPYLPALLGADGPRRYLIMAQNEDELRATGGFLTGAGVVTVENGRIADLHFRDSSDVDNIAAKPYDFPPQPLYDFMGLEVFVFRDANYWPDFPTSARKAMDLYAYGLGIEPLDGAIAIDQEFLRLLVEATGPVPIPDSEQVINANNLLKMLREARDIQEGQEVGEWVLNRKAFLGGFAAAIQAKVETEFGNIDLPKLARNMSAAANSRHLSIYLRDPDAAAALAATGWDGRLPSAPPGDFIMAVDTNVGYNKVNLLVERTLTYEVDLGPQPTATLNVLYTHTGEPQDEPCFQGVTQEFEQAMAYLALADKCYWNYLRVYAPGGSVLMASSSHTVPGETLLNGRTWEGPAQTVAEQPGLTTFANFMLLPRAAELSAMFQYQLPAGVAQTEGDETVYRLTVFKQPGRRPELLAILVSLPVGTTLLESSLPAENVDGRWRMTTTLDSNVEITVRYR
jgi:hypothetical protein